MMGLFAVTIDAPDAPALARFYADLLGMKITYEGPDGALIAGGGKSVMFQQVSGHNPPRWPDPSHLQQAHLDILVDGLDAGQMRALELGASRLPGGGERFRVFADPADHPARPPLGGSRMFEARPESRPRPAVVEGRASGEQTQ